MSKKRVTFRKLVKMFLEWVEQSDRTTNTLRHYRGRLKHVRESIGDQDIESLKLTDIEQALADANRWPDGRMKAPDTRRSNAVVMQQVFAFAVKHRLLAKAPFDKLERPRTKKRERIPTAEEYATIEGLARPDFVPILRALRQTGARPGELASVQIEDYDREARLLVLKKHKTAGKTGKTGKPRKIGVGQKFGEIVDAAIGQRTTGHIFLDGAGRPWTTASASTEFRRCRNKAGIDKAIVLYSNRHWFATEMCEKVGIHATAQQLGHASITTTTRYLHPDDSQLAINQDLV